MYHVNRGRVCAAFTMIKKRITHEYLAEGSISLSNKTLSTCDMPSTIVFKETHTFKLGPGDFHMGWCNKDDPYKNVIINLKYGSYSTDGVYHRPPNFRDNSADLCAKAGDTITFDYDQTELFLIINETRVKLDIHPSMVEEKDLANFNVICYMCGGNITMI